MNTIFYCHYTVFVTQYRCTRFQLCVYIYHQIHQFRGRDVGYVSGHFRLFLTLESRMFGYLRHRTPFSILLTFALGHLRHTFHLSSTFVLSFCHSDRMDRERPSTSIRTFNNSDKLAFHVRSSDRKYSPKLKSVHTFVLLFASFIHFVIINNIEQAFKPLYCQLKVSYGRMEVSQG